MKKREQVKRTKRVREKKVRKRYKKRWQVPKTKRRQMHRKKRAEKEENTMKLDEACMHVQ